MCTSTCPCYIGDDGENLEAFAHLDEDDLNFYGRTWDLDAYGGYYVENWEPMIFVYDDFSFESL